MLADAYIGCIYALASAPNPYRMQQAALACRDLMRAVPDHFGYDLSAFKTSVASKMRMVLDKHGAAIAGSDCRVDDSWVGPIDKPLRDLLLELDSYVDWQASTNPRLAERVAQAMAASDPAPSDVPSDIAEARTRSWMKLDRFFNDATHNKREKDFRERKEQLEVILLDMLRPQTFQEFAEIDQLLAEVDGA